MEPKHLNKSPIIEALIEVRFNSILPQTAVFGIIYDSIKDIYPGAPMSLPVLQLPEHVRNVDKQFEFAPHYLLQNENYKLQIGPKVLIFSCKMPYKRWEEFMAFLSESLQLIEQKNILTNITRIGHRYINFFKNNQMEFLNLNLSLSNPEVDLGKAPTSIRTEIKNEEYIHILQIANQATAIMDGKPLGVGTIIDIDTIIDLPNCAYNEFIRRINEMHGKEKTLFFSLLKPELIAKMNPFNE